MEIFEYITVNLLLFSSWYILLFQKRDSLSFADRILGTVVLALAQIVATEMLLGVLFKKLYALPLFVFNVSLSLGILIFITVRRKSALTNISESTPYCAGSFVPCLLRDILKELKEKVNRFVRILKSDGVLLTIFILFLVSLCYLIFIGYLFPSYSWDALFYHLPTIGFILQSEAIENIPYNSLIYTFINIFPKNIDLFFLWNVIFLKSDVIVDLSQLFFTLAGMLALYSMAVKLKMKERYAAYSSLLFFFAPVIILQSTANYVDIGVSVLFLIAMNFITGSGSEGFTADNLNFPSKRNIHIFLSGITAGILLGSKGSGPLFVFALSVLFLINELRIKLSLRRQGIISDQFSVKKIILRYAIYFMLPVILLGSYWYINNWVYYDNPVYPFMVTLFGKTIFRGIFTEMLNPIPDVMKSLSPFVRPFYVWLDKVEYYYYASDIGGFGPLWFILFLPAIGFFIFFAIRRKKYDFLVIALTIIFVFIFYPMGWTPRYVIFFFGLGSLAFGSILDYFERTLNIQRGVKALRFIVLVLVIYTLLVSLSSPCITPGKIKEFVALPVEDRTLSMMEPCIIDKTQRDEYKLWEWVSSNVSEGETLAYTFTLTLISPLWNSSFSNKIVFVKAGNLKDLIKTLEANKATYILVLGKPMSIEYWWFTRLWEIRNNPEWSAIYNRFKLEFSDGKYLVMRFR